MCSTISNILNVKSANCVDDHTGDHNGGWSYNYEETDDLSFEQRIDNFCALAQVGEASIKAGKGIILSDGTTIYGTGVNEPFGMLDTDYNIGKRRFITRSVDSNGFTNYYKVLCVDIDGVQSLDNIADCKGLCPFAYAVRYDGKIASGAKAEEWLAKSIQEKD